MAYAPVVDASAPPYRFARTPIVYVEPNGDGGYQLEGYVRLNRPAPRMGHGAQIGLEVSGLQTKLDTRVTDSNSYGAQTLGPGSRACYGVDYGTLPADIGNGRKGQKVRVAAYVRGTRHPLRATVRIRRRSKRGFTPAADRAQVALGCVKR